MDGFKDRNGRHVINISRAKPASLREDASWFGRKTHKGATYAAEVEEVHYTKNACSVPIIQVPILVNQGHVRHSEAKIFGFVFHRLLRSHNGSLVRRGEDRPARYYYQESEGHHSICPALLDSSRRI